MTIDFKIPQEGIDLYVHRRINDLNTLKKALKNKMTSDFFRIGHGLKGNAVSFGFPELESLGERLEHVAKIEDWIIAKSLLVELKLWCLIQRKKQHKLKSKKNILKLTEL